MVFRGPTVVEGFPGLLHARPRSGTPGPIVCPHSEPALCPGQCGARGLCNVSLPGVCVCVCTCAFALAHIHGRGPLRLLGLCLSPALAAICQPCLGLLRGSQGRPVWVEEPRSGPEALPCTGAGDLARRCLLPWLPQCLTLSRVTAVAVGYSVTVLEGRRSLKRVSPG